MPATNQERPEAGLAIARSHARRQVPAWVLSSALHFLIFIALALFVQVPQRGARVDPDRTGGIILVQQQTGRPQYYGESDLENAAAESSAASPDDALRITDALPRQHDFALNEAGLLPAVESEFAGLGDELRNALPGAGDFTVGARPNKQVGGKTETGVYGVRGVGSKFVYVFDRSGSMNGFQGRPLASAKAEMLKSIDSLEEIHQFQIIFYNERPSIFNPFRPQAPRLMFGDASSKQMAAEYVNSVVADGGTRHLGALQLALQLAPDVIFFLTDAAEPSLSTDELDQIRRRNERVGASINSIEFGSGPYNGEDNFLVKLARQNGGRHAYVDVSRLP